MQVIEENICISIVHDTDEDGDYEGFWVKVYPCGSIYVVFAELESEKLVAEFIKAFNHAQKISYSFLEHLNAPDERPKNIINFPGPAIVCALALSLFSVGCSLKKKTQPTVQPSVIAKPIAKEPYDFPAPEYPQMPWQYRQPN